MCLGAGGGGVLSKQWRSVGVGGFTLNPKPEICLGVQSSGLGLPPGPNPKP